MTYLNSLINTLNYWNGQVTSLNSQLKKLRKRKKDVNNVKASLNSVTNSNASNANINLHSARNNLASGISYTGKDSQLNSVLFDKDERTLGTDPNLTSGDYELQLELNDIENRISEVESELATANRNVINTNNAIAAEEKRIEEEAAAAAAAATAAKAAADKQT